MRRFILLLFLFCPLFVSAQQDSLLSAVLWEETSPGVRAGYVLRFNPFGTFEEDAGMAFQRSVRYLLGRYELDSTQTTLTFAVDFFMGDKLVHRRYRRGQDFYLDYTIELLDANRLELKDLLTGDLRTFTARPIKDTEDAATRRIHKIKFDPKGGLNLPGSGGLH